MKFTAEQEHVRTAPTVPLTTIEAGAGTGKTFLLTRRAQFLVSRGTPAQNLLFLTFTRQAREELEQRLQKLGLNCYVKTLHSFALQARGWDVNILDEQDARWKKMLSELRIQHSFHGQTVEQALEQAWQQGKDAGLARLRLREDAETGLQGLISKQGKPLMPLSLLLPSTVEQWQQSPETLEALRSRYQHVFIDEAQDLSPLQVEFVNLLGEGRCLTIVGDPQQSIFSFQHSAPGVFDTYVQRSTLSFPLTVNFRSPGQHLLAAAALTGKMLVPATGFRGSLEVRWSESPSDLIEELCQGVERFLAVSPGEEVTILVRSRHEIQEVTGWLRDRSLSVHTTLEDHGTMDDYCRDVLRPVTRFLLNRKQPSGRHPLLSLPEFSVLSLEYRELFNMAWSTHRRVSQVRDVSADPESTPFLDLWGKLEDWTGSSEELLILLNQVYPTAKVSTQARHYTQKAADISQLHRFLEPYASAEEIRIRISTIHGAKGLEWRNVILFEGDGRYSRPAYLGDDDPEFLEEVRLRYVAVTRSTENLLAVLHHDCHPAYHLAFSDENMRTIKQTEEVLLEDTKPNETLINQLWTQQWFEEYIGNYATPREVQRVGDTEAITGKIRLSALGNPLVRRISLTGWQDEGHT